MGIEKSKNSTYINSRYSEPFKVVGSALCDFSGFVIQVTDQEKQTEYSGQGLYYTGMLPHKKFADLPQPQLLKPKILKDPLPIRDARPVPMAND